MIPVPVQILGIDTTQTIDHEIRPILETETIDQETIHITDPIINEPITNTIIIDHEMFQKIGIQFIAVNKEIILNLLIEIIIAIPIPNTNIEATHRNIKDKLIKYNHLKKQLQTLLVSKTQKVLNYN